MVSELTMYAAERRLSHTAWSTQENVLGQKFIVDATLTVDLAKAGKTDNVHDTVSYADVYRYKLIET